MSISHVVSWYRLGNPISWSIYLSVAIEIFALASVSASTLRISKGAIWFLFSLVTLIQIIGNVFFEYTYIDVNGESFKSWLELISPIVDDWGIIEHKRLLAIVQGGTLPIMSLTALHFFIQFNEEKNVKLEKPVEQVEPQDLSEEDKSFLELDIDDLHEDNTEEESNRPLDFTDSEVKENLESKIEENKVKEIEPTKLQLARNYWGKTKGAFDGVSKNRILEHYDKKFKNLSNS